MHQPLLILLFLIAHIGLKAQKSQLQFADRFVLGVSGFYTFFENDFNPSLITHYSFVEVDFAVNLNPSWYVGFKHQQIQTNGSTVLNVAPKKQNFQLTGIFTQYDFAKRAKTKSRTYIETSFNMGDFCHCGEGDPFRRPNSYYFGVELGFDYPLADWLSVSATIGGYRMIRRISDTYRHGAYTVGVNFDLVRG